MAAQNKLFQRLIWLADTIYSAKRITMEEIDSRWSKSPYNDAHESQYGKRNFSRHKDTIAELFGIEIVCDRSTNTYSINDVSRASGSDVLALPMRNSTSAWFLWGSQMIVASAWHIIKNMERSYHRV